MATKTREQGGTRAERVRAGSRRRREAQRTELRQTILDAAGELFLEQGYERFSMRNVAERIGYTATTIYRYFANKDELLFAVIDRGFERFGAALASASASTADSIERLRALGRAYIRFGLENPVYYQVMFMHRSDYLTRAPEGSATPRHATFQILEDAVDAAVAEGRLGRGDPRDVSFAIWSLVHGIVTIALTLGPKMGLDAERTFEAGARLLYGDERPT